mmetsp:Transcript_17259/g.16466  ORF Transcript_17259/g.16466 Transcript_17259/m.16466 type:complete len:133 (+) Transcript_17259:176-574(+)
MPFQVLLHFDLIYQIFYSGFLLFTTIYKGTGGLRFPPAMWELELATVFFYFLTQMFRIMIGSQGNRTEYKISIAFFGLFTMFTIAFGVYFSTQTTYVLLVEIVVGAFGIFFGVLELISSVIAFCLFKRAEVR